ncbi:hypothetical protein [Haloarcula laminariae]|uniref:hypothetical protein n=1 Tax=Haloarcula laminariae TaxID=2961577 RepID=UPI0021C94FF4|nr:hypothetical protein [Halomicroarcula laminariae]
MPLGADQDAALLSRPRGEPTQTVENHQSPYRLSLLTGEVTVPAGQTDADRTDAIRELVQIDDPDELHQAWLAAVVPTQFAESMYYPYTSLKYHTLLTATLYATYSEGADFGDLFLVVEPDDELVPQRTIIDTDAVTLSLTTTPGDRPAAWLGPAPARSWADVWQRLPAHLLPDTRRARMLDAQLRRIRSWSTALQYIEAFQQYVGALEGSR